jgi:hypothetical protein
MTHKELIEKARKHLVSLDTQKLFGVPADVFDQSRVVEATLIYLDSQTRDDCVQVLLNSATGDVISVEYHPSASGGESDPTR